MWHYSLGLIPTPTASRTRLGPSSTGGHVWCSDQRGFRVAPTSSPVQEIQHPRPLPQVSHAIYFMRAIDAYCNFFSDGLVGTVTEKHKQMKAAVKRIQFLPKTDSSGAPGPPTLTTAPENSSLQCTQEAAAETVGGARQPAVCSTETLSAPPPVTRDTNEKEEITAIAEEEV